MKKRINNIEDLKWELARLTELKREQEAYLDNQFVLLKDKIDKPVRIFNSLTSFVPGFGLAKDLVFGGIKATKESVATEGDWLNRVVRIGIPLLLNRTLLRNSSWLKKSLVLLASETAAGQVTQQGFMNLISKVAGYIRPTKSKHKKHKSSKHANHQENLDDSPEDQILGI